MLCPSWLGWVWSSQAEVNKKDSETIRLIMGWAKHYQIISVISKYLSFLDFVCHRWLLVVICKGGFCCWYQRGDQATTPPLTVLQQAHSRVRLLWSLSYGDTQVVSRQPARGETHHKHSYNCGMSLHQGSLTSASSLLGRDSIIMGWIVATGSLQDNENHTLHYHHHCIMEQMLMHDVIFFLRQ